MPEITIFQCLPAYRARPTHRIIHTLEKLNCRILLDLEDSIGDVASPGKSAFLKERARVELEELFRLNPYKQFDIRINPPHSEEYPGDICLINKHLKNVRSIFIPKIESIAGISRVLNDIKSKIPVNPIIESVSGLDNAKALCIPEYKNRIEFFFFGNYDFHLDGGIFPIREQYSEPYWEIAEPLIHLVERDFHFGNSPYAGIDDLNTLQYILFRLNKYCKKNFAVVSLHKKQTLEYSKPQSDCTSQKVPFSFPDEEIINTYKSAKLKDRSFALDKKTNRIITPQEYMLAINHSGK